MWNKILSYIQGPRPKRTAIPSLFRHIPPSPAASLEPSQPSSPLMASSRNLEGNYHVFLSFRGTDVRKNFLGHLNAALEREGIYTYVDSEELRKGEQITPALMKAIQDSRIAIIIFSENYASSPWCLGEVAKIMECMQQRGLMVFPVFYKVDPREVRTPRQSYREAMVKHERKFGKDSEKVTRWKKALLDAGSLSGWTFNDEDEADFIKRIVKEISMQLLRTPLDVAKHPVGIHPRIVDLKSMLNLESDNDVLMIGLWGQGGIGKTTLAKALYNDIFRRFEASCFLANVRETSKDSKDLVPLQEKLLSEILLGKELTVSSVDGGINLIKDRLCRKKVLLILDDVNDVKQLNALAREHEWFGKGSRIIITTRDNHLLTAHGIDEDQIYEVKTLKNREALELFSKHAFLRNNERLIRQDLVDSASHYAGGLPLALEVLGSFLCGRREEEWESALKKLAKSPNETINTVLKLSYDGLEDYAKEIFLDIACFFNGQSIEHITEVLNSCDFDTTIGVQVLVEKSLITKGTETIWMHDLIQLMGMDIVKQECHDDPRGRSRLWLYEDVRDVLSWDVGSNAIKAIVLVLFKKKPIYMSPNALGNMRRLRLLIMINVHNSFQGPIYLPNELRWFQWPECASLVLEFPLGPKKLVRLDLHRSNIQVAIDQFKDFTNLKFLNFSECPSMVCMPDLYLTPNLEELDLHGCKNLERAHESIAYHAKLRLLNLKGCSNLHHLPDVLQSKNLDIFNLEGCSKLQRFPDIPDKIEGLRELYLTGTSIEELPASIENLVSLGNLNLNNCKKLANLPSSIYKLPNLEILGLNGCPKLIKFPKKEEDLSDLHSKVGFPKLHFLDLKECNLLEIEFLENHSCFPYLRYLYLSHDNFSKLPTRGRLHNLCHLPISKCQQLQEIGKIPGQYLELICKKQFCSRLDYQILLPGGEMPQWLLPNKGGYISFRASKDLYKKFLVLAICVVLRAKEWKQNVRLLVHPFINGKRMGSHDVVLSPLHLDNVCFLYLGIEQLWGEDAFGPNDSLSSFQCGIEVTGGGIVKKCGFRLICKQLEDNLEALYQDNELLDSGLLYEICHDAKEMTTEEKTSADLSFERWLRPHYDEGGARELLELRYCDHRVNIMADFSVEKYRYSGCHDYRNIIPGGDMPEEFVLVEGSTISFMVSQGFYDKFEGLVLCIVFSVEDGENEIIFEIKPYINGQRRNVISGSLGSFYSGHMWIQYLEPNLLWGVLEGAVDFLEFDEDYLHFSLTIKLSGGSVEKLGYVLKCVHMDDNWKVVLEDNQLIDPASIYKLEWGDFICKFFRGVEDSDTSDCSKVEASDNSDNSEVEASNNSEVEVEASDNSEVEVSDNSDNSEVEASDNSDSETE